MNAIPVPDPDPFSAAFFGGLDAGRLCLQACGQCGTVYIAFSVCDICGSTAFKETAASGFGIIHSFTWVHVAHHPAFENRLPVCGGIVELDEGPRLFAPILGIGARHVGERVRYEPVSTEDRTFAAFRAIDRREDDGANRAATAEGR